MSEGSKRDSLNRDNNLADFSDHLISGIEQNYSGVEGVDRKTIDDQKVAQLIYQVGKDGVPSKRVANNIRKTLETKWKEKWPAIESESVWRTIIRRLIPKQSDWKSTKKRQKNLTISIAVVTIVVMLVVIGLLPDNYEGLSAAADQGGVIPLVIFSLLVLGIGVWWFITRNR